MAKETRSRILTKAGLALYRSWLKDEMTQIVLQALKEETRIRNVPQASLENPQVASALYHHKVGYDSCIAAIEDMENSKTITEIEATYGGQ